METIKLLEKSIKAEKALLDLSKECLRSSMRTSNVKDFIYWTEKVRTSKKRIAQLTRALENLKTPKPIIVEMRVPALTPVQDIKVIARQIQAIAYKYNIELVVK